MKHKNIVFIAKSIDGFIADKNGKIDWLELVPNPDQIDMGYTKLIEEIDAIVMGRTTFETVLGFGIEWPYEKPVFVLSHTLKSIPKDLKEKVFLLSGDVTQVLQSIHELGFYNLYIDGGRTIQNFLEKDQIHEMILTTIPVVLGGGFSLFGELNERLEFNHVESKVHLNQIVQDRYVRKR